MSLIIPILALTVFIALANFVALSKNKVTHLIFDIALALLNGLVALLGLVLVAAEPLLNNNIADFGLPPLDMGVVGWGLVAIGIWGVLMCIRPLRRLLARIMPLNPHSPVHTFALVLAGYLVGNTFLTLGLGGLEILGESELTVSIVDIVIQQLAFIVVAFAGVGLFIRRDYKQSIERIGLQKPTLQQLVWATGLIFFLVLMQGAAGALWALLDPEQAEQLSTLNETLLGDFDSVGEWLVLALGAGFGEEILFRGAIQPAFGLGVTSLLFAIIHVQYGLTPITLMVFFIGLILGLVRRQSSTTVAIYVHVGYNFILGLLSLLAIYLEQFIN